MFSSSAVCWGACVVHLQQGYSASFCGCVLYPCGCASLHGCFVALYGCVASLWDYFACFLCLVSLHVCGFLAAFIRLFCVSSGCVSSLLLFWVFVIVLHLSSRYVPLLLHCSYLRMFRIWLCCIFLVATLQLCLVIVYVFVVVSQFLHGSRWCF